MKDKINKDLEDIGWASMRSLLDKEIPKEGALIVGNTEGVHSNHLEILPSEMQEEGGRKKWLWLLLLLCFVGCGVVSFQLLKEQDAENCIMPIAQIEENNSDISANNAVLKNSNSGKSTTNNIENSEKKAQNNDEISVNTSFLKQEKKIFKDKKVDRIVEKNITQNIDSQYFNKRTVPIFDDEKQASILLKQPSNNSVFNNTEILNKKLINGLKTPFTAFLPLDKIALLDSFNVINKVSEIPILSSIKPIKMPSKIEWGITAGTHSILKITDNSWLNGFQLGTAVSKPISPRLAISTGWAFRTTVANGDSLTYIQADTSAQSSKSTSTASPAFNLTNGTAVRLNRLRYIEMPLFLTYKINGKWGVSSGVKASYLISKNFTTAYNSNVYVLNSSNNAFDRSASNVIFDNSSAAALGLKRWDFALMGALNYHILPHFNISARYDFGLNNIFKKPNWVAHNRYLGVNVAYIF